MNTHYDKEYFEWQRKIGEFGGKAELFKFENYIKGSENILEFGCGGGWLLKNIKTTGRKCGVEINPSAVEVAKENGVNEVFTSINDIKDNSFDLIISHHALEHVDNPFEVLSEMKRCLKSGGQCVIVVPHETSDTVNEKDINMHLYTWSPQNLYNLFKRCGFEVERCERIVHCWVPNYVEFQEKYGWEKFHKACQKYSKKTKSGYQTICCGKKV